MSYGATGFAAILDFAFSHLSCVICHLSCAPPWLLAMRFASFAERCDWVNADGTEGG